MWPRQLVIVKAIVGVAATDAVAGDQVEVACEDVYDLAKNAPDAFNPGDVKVAAGSNVIAAAGTLGIGWVLQSAAAELRPQG